MRTWNLKLYGDGVGRHEARSWHLDRQAQSAADRARRTHGPASARRVALSRCATKTITSISPALGKSAIEYKVAGFHLLRPIVKLADGTWLVGDHADGLSADWHEDEISLADLRWRKLDIKKVIEAPDGKWIEHPDLSKVDEIGFTDLMAGSGHGPGGWSDVGRIEVYGKPVKRQ